MVPSTGWAYNGSGAAISLLPAGKRFVAGDIYEFSYTAKDPTVNGLGFAAVRDWNAFLRYESKDEAGTANPLAGDVTRIYTEVRSQPGRMLNDFRTLGFNQAENGRKVFDGMLQWIAAGDGINMNYRFSQPGRTERNRQDHLYVEGVFPFANVSTTDPITGKTASRYDRCIATNTCPLAMEIYSANEYWVKAASLMHTDPAGKRDLPESPYARLYFISSHQHGTGNAGTRGACQQFQNPLDSAPIQRALFVALDEWSTKGTLPPVSQVPRLSDGTLVPSSSTGLPHDSGRHEQRPEDDALSAQLRAGLLQDGDLRRSIRPCSPRRIRTTPPTARSIRASYRRPIATATTWPACGCLTSPCRSRPTPAGRCAAARSRVTVARALDSTSRSRRRRPSVWRRGDPRLSVEERYSSFSQYSAAVRKAIDDLVARRLMLREDVESNVARLLQAGRATGAIKDGPTATASR